MVSHAEGGEVPPPPWRDPTHGRIDRDIQEYVDREIQPPNVAVRVAIENTLQERRDRGETVCGLVVPRYEPPPDGVAVGRELLQEGTVDGVPTKITAPRGGVQYGREPGWGDDVLSDEPRIGSHRRMAAEALGLPIVESSAVPPRTVIVGALGHGAVVIRNVGRRWRVRFAWYDLWIGAYWDHKTRTLYVCPLPTLLIEVRFGR